MPLLTCTSSTNIVTCTVAVCCLNTINALFPSLARCVFSSNQHLTIYETRDQRGSAVHVRPSFPLIAPSPRPRTDAPEIRRRRHGFHLRRQRRRAQPSPAPSPPPPPLFSSLLLITGFPSASTAGVSVAVVSFAVVSFADMVATRRVERVFARRSFESASRPPSRPSSRGDLTTLVPEGRSWPEEDGAATRRVYRVFKGSDEGEDATRVGGDDAAKGTVPREGPRETPRVRRRRR